MTASDAELDVAECEREALRLLDLLVRQPSVSAETSALPETAELVEELLAATGFETRRIAVEGSPPYVYGELPGLSDARVLLYNHYDVQPADPLDLWETPPFEPAIREGKLFGRGAADNKAQLAARLAVIRALRERDGAPPLTIRWIVEGEEEVGSPHFEQLAARHADLLAADAALWEGSLYREDGGQSLTLGFKGLLYVRLEVEVLGSDGHSAAAAVVPSAAWRLVGALSAIREPDGRITVARFFEDARPPSPADLEAVAEQPPVDDDLRAAFGVREFLDGLEGRALNERASFAPTANIAGIHAGYAGPGMKTVLPARASARLDFRLVPDQRAAEIARLLRDHLDAQGYGDLTIDVLAAADPVRTPIDHPLVRRVAAVAERVAGRPPAIVPLAGGTLPLLAALERHVGVPGLSAPDNPVYFGSRAHAPNEHIRLVDLPRAMRVFAAVLEDLGAGTP